jgi:hypothetical protein
VGEAYGGLFCCMSGFLGLLRVGVEDDGMECGGKCGLCVFVSSCQYCMIYK